jgi:two-component system NtrC family sensor kinase
LNLQEALPLLRCDNSQMQQVVLNLVMNGAEATHKNGKGNVWISTRTETANQQVVLEIRDDGEGIPKENLSKIFDPFFTTKEEGKGVGLGLAVVYGIVEAHQGDIEVSSRLGAGTSFRVVLPVSGVESASAPASGRPASAGQKG